MPLSGLQSRIRGMMGKKDPRVDAYIAAAADFARPVLVRVRRLVHRACPGVEETIKWGFPHFDYKGVLCGIAAFREHCALGFWKGKLIVDLDSKRSAEAMGQFGRLRSVVDLPGEERMLAMIREAARLNDEGVRVERKPRPRRKALRTPPDLASALRRNVRAKAAFGAFTPGKRRDYVEWLSEAKTDETRRRGLATAVAWIAEGKVRNWKYERT